jgi:dTDP-4-amino-4,6-dideoxygalactose transaminase
MKIPPAQPYFSPDEIESILVKIKQSLQKGSLTRGPYIQEFELQFAKYIGVDYAIAVNSGTCSLEIPLRAFGVNGSEVIVPTNSFVATANAVIFAGGIPVLAEIEKGTLCLDPNDLQNRLTSKTAGVIVVHIGGLPHPGIKKIKEFCRKHNLFLIEDAAHAAGAEVNGIKAGALCDAGSFSFFPTKMITTGEGGMITTNDENIYKKALSLRHHGIKMGTNVHDTLGYNWRMPEINAILGVSQLSQLEDFISKRTKLAQRYNTLLKSIKEISPILGPDNVRHCFWKYPIIIEKGIDCESVVRRLADEYQIGTRSLYNPPIHLQPYYRENYGYKEGDFPIAEDILSRVICLPMYADLKGNEVDYVCKSLLKIFDYN